MKKIILSFLFLVSTICYAQEKANVQDEQLKDYIEITMTDFSGSIRIDYGGKIDKFIILDGKKYTFSSCISAVKFLESRGWKVEVAQATAYNGGLCRYYLMSKVVTKEELEKVTSGVTEG